MASNHFPEVNNIIMKAMEAENYSIKNDDEYVFAGLYERGILITIPRNSAKPIFMKMKKPLFRHDEAKLQIWHKAGFFSSTHFFDIDKLLSADDLEKVKQLFKKAFDRREIEAKMAEQTANQKLDAEIAASIKGTKK